jgi:hypothetical protein
LFHATDGRKYEMRINKLKELMGGDGGGGSFIHRSKHCTAHRNSREIRNKGIKGCAHSSSFLGLRRAKTDQDTPIIVYLIFFLFL